MLDEEKLEATGVSADAAPGKKTKKRSKKKLTKEERLALIREKERNGQELTANEVEELAKERERVRTAVESHRKRDLQDSSFRRYNCATELTEKNAREILADDWGLKNPRAIDTILELAETAADHHKLRYNAHLFRHGLRQTVLANKSSGPVERPEVENGEVAGELLSRRELYCIWDHSMFREPDLTFEQFLEIRAKCKRDWFYLGKEILGKDFHECHRRWQEFLPAFDPTTLPANYDQEQMKEWLGRQGRETDKGFQKSFLLLASRNAYKSSASLVFALTAVLCCPDMRLLLVSETKNLSKGFIRGFRSYWEVSNKNNPTRFQQLFADYCIPAGDGSTLTFESPMAHLNLIQATAESTSMDSVVAGNRADAILFDDPISNFTCTTEEQRQSSIFKYALILKLGEVGHIVTTLGTPWHPEDLYAKVIENSKEDSSIAVRLDPAWVLKKEARNKPLKEIEEGDVESLLFPERLTFKFLKRELKNSGEKFFRSQNLVEFVPDEEDLFKCNFDEDLIRKYMRPRPFFTNLPFVTSVLAVDVAFSTSKYADFSCLVFGEVRRLDNNYIFVTTDVVMDRFKQSELALQICLSIQRNNPQRVIIERSGAHEALQEQIARTAVLRGISIPSIFWKSTTGAGTIASKAGRIKGTLESKLQNGQLWHVSSSWTEAAMQQLVNFDGLSKSSRTKHDDYPDALERAVAYSFPRTQYEEEKLDPKIQEQERQEAMRRHAYNRIFGVEFQPQPRPAAPEPPLARPDPRDKIFGGSGLSTSRRRFTF